MIKKYTFTLVLIALLLAALTTSHAQEPTTTPGHITAATANVYALPQPDTTATGTLPRDTPIEILEARDGWFRITAQQSSAAINGWVVDSAADYDAALPAAIPLESLRRVVVASESVSLRGKAELTARRITNLPNGAHAYILDDQGDWLRVHYMDTADFTQYEGWVLKRYTVVEPIYITLQAVSDAYAYPDEGAPRVAMLDAYTRLLVLGEVDGFWAISLRGASAFVPSQTRVWQDGAIAEGQ